MPLSALTIHEVNGLHMIINRPKNRHQKTILLYWFSVDAQFRPDNMLDPNNDEGAGSSYALNTRREAKLIKLLQSTGMDVDDGHLPPPPSFKKLWHLLKPRFYTPKEKKNTQSWIYL